MSSSALFIEAAANTVRLLVSAEAGEGAAPKRMTKAARIPARRYMAALRACSQRAVRAPQSGVGWVRNATGGSAVPAIRQTYDPSGHRAGELTALSGRRKGSQCRLLLRIGRCQHRFAGGG